MTSEEAPISNSSPSTSPHLEASRAATVGTSASHPSTSRPNRRTNRAPTSSMSTAVALHPSCQHAHGGPSDYATHTISGRSFLPLRDPLDDLDPGVVAELGQDPLHVAFGRPLRDDQPVRDLLVGQT